MLYTVKQLDNESLTALPVIKDDHLPSVAALPFLGWRASFLGLSGVVLWRASFLGSWVDVL